MLVSFRGLHDEDEKEVSDRDALEPEFRQALAGAMMVQAWIAASSETSRRDAVTAAADEIGGEDASKFIDEIMNLVARLPPIDDPLAETEPSCNSAGS